MSRLQHLKKHSDEAWLIVEWITSTSNAEIYAIVSNKWLVESELEDLYTGKVVHIRQNDTARKARIVMVSADKKFLEKEIRHLTEAMQQINFSKQTDTEDEEAVEFTHTAETESENYETSDSEWSPELEDRKFNKGKKKNIQIIMQKSCDNSYNFPEEPGQETSSQNKSSIISNADNTSSQYDDSRFNSLQIDNDANTSYLDDNIYQGTQRLNKMFKNIKEPVTSTPQPKIPPMTFDQQTQTDFPTHDKSTYDMLIENQDLIRTEMLFMYDVLNDIKDQRCEFNKRQNLIENLYYELFKIKNMCTNKNNNSKMDAAVPVMNDSILKDFNSVDSYSPTKSSINRVNNKQITKKRKNWGQKVILKQSTESFEVLMNNNTSSDSIPKARSNSDSNSESEVVVIGSGKTEVPRHVYNQIRWNSYTNATRKLLMAVFPRRTLATHSLTGKSSPAFTNRPPKMKLDEKKVSDIIMTVTEMCNVPENLVRTSITTKCSDENKMYRIRLNKAKNKNMQDNIVNQENLIPL